MRLILFLPALWAMLSAQRPVHDEAERLAKWKQISIPYRAQTLNAAERRVVEKLVDACRLLDRIYWLQNDGGGYQLFRASKDATVRTLFSIMGGRYDLLDENRPFLGEQPAPPGRDLYPHDLTAKEVEAYLIRHPEDRKAVYDPYTVVKRSGGRLIGVPYHEEYKALLQPAAKALREAAALSPDKAFAEFLLLRAAALLTSDYFASDIAWLDLKAPKTDLIYAPYETEIDGLLGVKTSFGAAVLIRREEESRKLELYRRYVPEMQEALPLSAEDRPSKRGRVTPMEVMDAPYRAGDLRHGYQAVADNLPNDPRVHEQKGSKKIFFQNFMEARVAHVILPVAKALLAPEFAAKVTAEGYMAGTILHEIAHGLGPAYARVGGKQADIRESLGPVSAALEEAKADIVGQFGLRWLTERGALPKNKLEEYYASHVSGIFRTVRFGAGEAHSRAEVMEFNYFAENGVIGKRGGAYVIEFAKMPEAVARLAKELLEMEATGDRKRAEAWFAKYGTMTAELKADLKRAAAVPVDVAPVFAFE